MTSPADASAPDEQCDDRTAAREGPGGQVSETSAMTPEGGADGTPGTDDGVPPAEDGGPSRGRPRSPTATDRFPLALQGILDFRRGSSAR